MKASAHWRVILARREVDLARHAGNAVVGLADRVGVEGVGRQMSAPAARYLVQISEITSGRVRFNRSLLPFWSCVNSRAGAEARLVEPVALDHRAVGPVLHQDALLGDLRSMSAFSARLCEVIAGRTPRRWQMAKVRSARLSV